MVNRKLNAFIHKHPSLMALVAFVLVVVPGFIVTQHALDANHKLAKCVDDWANGYQSRATTVQVAANGRADALDGLLRSLSRTTPPQLYVDLRDYINSITPSQQHAALAKLASDQADLGAKEFAALDGYIKASDHYNMVLAQNPLAKVAKKLQC